MRYAIILHRIVPHEDDKTNRKDYGTTGQKKVIETFLFENKVKNRILQEASYVYDLVEDKILKNRYNIDETQLKQYIVKEYGAEIVRRTKHGS